MVGLQMQSNGQKYLHDDIPVWNMDNDNSKHKTILFIRFISLETGTVKW